MKKIKATIRKDGTVKIEVIGAVGAECLDLTRALEKRLGIQSGERELKQEYYESEVERDREREGQQ